MVELLVSILRHHLSFLVLTSLLYSTEQKTISLFKMKSFIAFAAILACAAAAPGLLLAHETPVVHAVHAAPILPVVGSKTTITKSSQVVNHGTPVVHAPVVHAAPIVHATPIVHSAPVVHAVHAPVAVIKTAPVAVAHSSSVVHHTPIVKTVPILAVHH